MSLRVTVALVAVLLVPVRWTDAQDLGGLAAAVTPATPSSTVWPDADLVNSADQRPVILPATIAPGRVTFGAPAPLNPFTSIGHDLRRFFSRDTADVLTILAPAIIIGSTWDKAGIEESQEHLSKRVFQPGNIGGGFLVQTGAAVGTWAVGKLTGSTTTTAMGGDLIRAQLVSQTIVQGIKFSTRRSRPDNSNRHSFPSGHTASAFATASVLERHLGPRVGIPAYTFASFVGLARMSANKHHISDVIMGAGIGIAAGRSVTMSVGGAKFDLGVAPTQGGAAVMFTKK